MEKLFINRNETGVYFMSVLNMHATELFLNPCLFGKKSLLPLTKILLFCNSIKINM